MSAALIFSCIWVLFASAVAFLPLRFQMMPGLALLLTAPLLIFWIGYEHGWPWAIGSTLAVLSLFRRPLVFLLRKALGHT